MKKSERLVALNKFLEEGRDLTTKELTLAGFSKYDLECLRKDTLISEGTGVYTLHNIDLLLMYGRGLLDKKDYDKACQCFHKILEFEPNNHEAIFRLFVNSISKSNYNEAFKFFDMLVSSTPEENKSDNYLYLFLLGLVTKIPKKYEGVYLSINYDSIKISVADKRLQDINLENIIRAKIYNRQLVKAVKFIENKDSQEDITEANIVAKILIAQYKKQCGKILKEKAENTLIDLIETQNYQGLVSTLTKQSQLGKSHDADKYIILLANQIIAIKEKGEYPVETAHKTGNYFKAIMHRNYKLALELSAKYDNKPNENFRPLKLLLEQMIDLLNKRINEKDVPDASTLLKSCAEEGLTGSLEKTAESSEPNIPRVSNTESKLKTPRNYLELIKSKKYKDLLNILMPGVNSRTSSQAEEYLAFLIGDLLSIKQTKKRPRIKGGKSYSLFIAILNQDYEAAFKFAKENLTKNSTMLNECFYLLLEDIMTEIKALEEPKSVSILNLIKEKQYEELVSYIENNGQLGVISDKEKAILKLARDILKIKSTNIVPNFISYGALTLYMAIHNNDYEIALKFSENYNIKNGYDKYTDPIYLLLVDINSYIKKPRKKEPLVLALLKSGNYARIIQYYKDKEKQRTLSHYNRHLLLIAEDLVNVKENGVIPTSNNKQSSSVFTAIDNKDYKGALRLAEYHCSTNEKDKDTDYLYLFLSTLNMEIEKVENRRAQTSSVTLTLILELIKNNECERLFALLTTKRQYSTLNYREENLLKLVGDYLDIKKTGKIPPILCTNGSTTSKAIEGNNYGLALELFQNLEKKGIDNSTNTLYLMLVKITSLIENIKKSPDSGLEVSPSSTSIQNEMNEFITIDMIFSALTHGHTDLALTLVHKFLEQIGATCYEFLVVSNIKCSILESDLAFISPMYILVNLKRGTFNFELQPYLNAFYALCDSGEVAEAELCLNIISWSKQILPNNIDINWLHTTLENAKNNSGGRK